MSFAHVLFDGFDLKYADTADLRGYIGQVLVQYLRCFIETRAHGVGPCPRSFDVFLSRTSCSLGTTTLARSLGASRAATRQISMAWMAFLELECLMQVAPMPCVLCQCIGITGMALDLFERKSIAGPACDMLCLADMESHDQRWRPSRSRSCSPSRTIPVTYNPLSSTI